MRLLHKDFDFFFEFKENEQNLLVVEQPQLFCTFVRELSSENVEDTGGFILSDHDCPIRKKDNLMCVVNPLLLLFNDRRLLHGLYGILQKDISSSDLLDGYNQLVISMENYIMQVLQSSDFELVYSEQMDIQSLLKALNVRFAQEQETLIEQLVDYIRVVCGILGIRCFIFVNLYSYLTEYEIKKLFEFSCYQKVHILLLESRQPADISIFAKAVLIDSDACEITWNS